jgi:hypothetical protein
MTKPLDNNKQDYLRHSTPASPPAGGIRRHRNGEQLVVSFFSFFLFAL